MKSITCDVAPYVILLTVVYAKLPYTYLLWEGRAIAQAVSRRLPTAAAGVQTRVWSCGIL
jgi:hypothetical protein